METGTVTGSGGANLRSSPNSNNDSNIKRLLPKGTPFTVLDRDFAPWFHVQITASEIGYLHKSVVSVKSQTGPEFPDLTRMNDFIASFPHDQIIPQGYTDFWAQRVKLGLPDPFDVSPVYVDDPAQLPVNGFGPNKFAIANWKKWYRSVCGMHNGLDHSVAAKTPLLALSDAMVVGNKSAWQFMKSKFERTLTLWCLLPESIRDNNGKRMLSNVLVAYGHMSDNTVVKREEMVKAGQLIGYSGFPRREDPDTHLEVEEPGNAHLHLEVHLLSGDSGLPYPRNRRLLSSYDHAQPFDNNTPFNPLLFFSPRLIQYHLHQNSNLGKEYPSAAELAAADPRVKNWPALDFFTFAYFQYPSVKDKEKNIVWNFPVAPPWPKGVYSLSDALERINNFEPFQPYPIPKKM